MAVYYSKNGRKPYILKFRFTIQIPGENQEESAA
jgi:hypothetical protein